MPLQIPSDAICMRCKQRLYGLEQSRCPKCGREFDPMDPATYDHDKLLALARGAQPPHKFASFAWMGMTCLLILDASMPGPSNVFGVCFCLVMGGIIFIDWLLRICCRVSLRIRRIPNDSRLPRRSRWHWATLPLCAALVASTNIGDWPLQVRFRLSRSAFDRTADALRAGRLSKVERQWIGCYWVRSGQMNQPGVIELNTGSYGVGMFGGRSGFIQIRPAGASLGPQNREYLDGGWFTYR